MNEFVQQLKASGRFLEAYLVAKNHLSHNIGDSVLFREYISLALEIASYDIVFEERRQYVADAASALEMYAETCDIDEEALRLIGEAKKAIKDTHQQIFQDEQAYIAAQKKQIEAENAKLLSALGDLYNKIDHAATQREFDKILAEIAQADADLVKDSFSEKQAQTYQQLTKRYSKTISRKMEEINRSELLEYNKQAVRYVNDVFQAFRTEPSRYKNESSLKSLMTSKFFCFDTSKLFNETLIFYNHVYSVVFQEVNDSLKYKLTEWALSTAKLQ